MILVRYKMIENIIYLFIFMHLTQTTLIHTDRSTDKHVQAKTVKETLFTAS